MLLENLLSDLSTLPSVKVCLRWTQSSYGYTQIYTEAFSEAFNDITSGTNQGCGTVGFTAVQGKAEPSSLIITLGTDQNMVGWDPVTGLGTPNFEKLKDAFLSLP